MRRYGCFYARLGFDDDLKGEKRITTTHAFEEFENYIVCFHK